MIKIRLKKLGKKGDPFYRIVVTDEKKKITGQSLANLGFWHPNKDIKKIDKKGIKDWVDKGAQVTEAVKKLISE